MSNAGDEALAYLFGRLNYERTGMPRLGGELRLERMRRLMRRLGDPQTQFQSVHVAGTKGKGSTASMIAACLTACGHRTGLYTSPHLHRIEERYRVDGQQISPEELVALLDRVRPVVDRLDWEADREGRRGPTFFEVGTALALAHFAAQGVDHAVIEVGMGGRLDSTNVIRPAVAVITSISYDHTRQLGNTLEAIAGEKAGIIKRRRPVVSGVRGDGPRGVIAAVARARGCRLRQIDRDFAGVYHPPALPLSRPEPGAVSARTWARDWGTLPLPLPGPHQADNAATALAALDCLAERGLEIAPDQACVGFQAVRFPARFEIVAENPWVVIDAAHNLASAQALAQTLRICAPQVPRTLIFGTTRDKDLEGQARALSPLFDQVIATRYLENPRSVNPDEITAAFRGLDPARPVLLAPGPAEALALALRITDPGGLICATGSLFLAAEVRAAAVCNQGTAAIEG